MLLRVIGTEGEVYHGQVEKILVPTEQGFLGILPGHMNLVTPIQSGDITYLPITAPTSVLDSFLDHSHVLTVGGGLMTIEDDIVLIALE